MTDAQRVILGRTLEGRLAELARERSGTRTDLGPEEQVHPRSDFGKTRDHVAKAVGLGSGDTYRRGSRLVERAAQVAPDVAESMANGSLTIREASHEVVW